MKRRGWSHLHLGETSALRFASATDDFLVGIVLITMKKHAKRKQTERLCGEIK